MLTTCLGDVQVLRALEAGARAYLLKSALRKELPETIRLVHAGHKRIVPEVAMELAEHAADDALSLREAAAFLVTMATRLAINVMQSARLRRETYVGPWLPEPVDTCADPALDAERSEALEAGILPLMETLSPTERAACILREAFG